MSYAQRSMLLKVAFNLAIAATLVHSEENNLSMRYKAKQDVQRQTVYFGNNQEAQKKSHYLRFLPGDTLIGKGFVDPSILPITHKDCNFAFELIRGDQNYGVFSMPEADFNTLTMGLIGTQKLYRWTQQGTPELIHSEGNSVSTLFRNGMPLRIIHEDSQNLTIAGVTKSLSNTSVTLSSKYKNALSLIPFSAIVLQNEYAPIEATTDPISTERDLFAELAELEKLNYSFNTVQLTDTNGLAPGIKKGQLFWTPMVSEIGDEIVLYSIPKKDKAFIVKKKQVQPYQAVSILKGDVKDDESGQILAHAGEAVYERSFDNQYVYFSIAGDPNETIFDAPKNSFMTLTSSLSNFEKYKNISKNYDPLLHSTIGKSKKTPILPQAPLLADDSDAGEFGSRRYYDDEGSPVTSPHNQSDLPIWSKNKNDLIQPSAKDCAKKGDSENAKYYLLKKPVPIAQRRKYKEAIIAAANSCNIHPAIIEASLHIETDFRESLENVKERDSIINLLSTKKHTATYDEAEDYVISKKKDIWGKSLGQISPTEAEIFGYDWKGKYSEKNAENDKSIWNPKNAIMATALVMRQFMDTAAIKAREKGLNPDEAIAHMFNRPGPEGLAEQARYLLSVFNRGYRCVNALDLYVDQHGKWPASYGQVWAEMPNDEKKLARDSKKHKKGFLWGQDINRGHVYKGAGLCGPLPEWSLVSQYNKEYTQVVGNDGKTLEWKSLVYKIFDWIKKIANQFLTKETKVI